VVIIFSKHLLGIFFALLMASSLGSSAWAASRFTRADRHSVVQVADLGGGTGIQAARPDNIPNNADHSAGRHQITQNTGTEAGNNSAPRFFFLTGFALIAARIIVSYRSRKVKNLAIGTN
jgi:hypothetical protein